MQVGCCHSQVCSYKSSHTSIGDLAGITLRHSASLAIATMRVLDSGHSEKEEDSVNGSCDTQLMYHTVLDLSFLLLVFHSHSYVSHPQQNWGARWPAVMTCSRLSLTLHRISFCCRTLPAELAQLHTLPLSTQVMRRLQYFRMFTSYPSPNCLLEIITETQNENQLILLKEIHLFPPLSSLIPRN